MATSGTYVFRPSSAELVVTGLSRVGVRRPQITVDHLTTARTEINLMLQEWGNDEVNLWTVDELVIPLVAGQSVYQLDHVTVELLDVYIRTGDAEAQNDRIMTSISRSEYASYPNKDQPGWPTVYWFNRQIEPQVTVWQPPDDSQDYFLHYYRMKQIEDVGLANGENPQLPNRFWAALTAGIAYRMAQHYNVALEAQRKADYQEAYMNALKNDVEDAPFNVQPQLDSYFR